MEDGRKQPRCSVHWRSAITVIGAGGAETLQCKTNDISVGGVSVICPRNIFPGVELTVYLLIDPGSPTHPQVIFEAQGKVMNTVLSSQQGGFRVGIQFTKYARDSQQLLKKHLPKDLVKPERLVTGGSTPPPAPAPVAEAPTAEAEQPATPDQEATPAAAAPSEGEAPSQS